MSLTAAVRRWLDVASGRAILIVSREGFMLWAKASSAAFRSGAFFATRQRTIEVPEGALAHSDPAWLGDQTQQVPARLRFAREPEDMVVTEMTRVAGAYDQTLTLLLMPPAEKSWRQPADEEGREPGRRLGLTL